ncbi:hypothetical protein LSCM1_04684 [Leishmania martiniquensis]|uniref:DUF4042 domain-containing protein n=1 Tax=Leishmania martiniquensis TaxID=1580590 RepID=A0A836KV98_9TRYP|nr:hypothetical protein LSCM1_04684 [Leishmania martiniquensis]
MGTPKGSARHGDRHGKSGNRKAGGAGAEEPASSRAATTARGVGNISLAYLPIDNLLLLRELLRPSAASRIAAAAHAVRVDADNDAASCAAGGQLTYGSARGRADATVSSSLPEAASSLSPPTLPPYGFVVPPNQPTNESPVPPLLAESTTATPPSVHNTAERDLSANTCASEAAPIPPLPLVLECTTQLSGILAQWRAGNESKERCPPGPPLAPAPALLSNSPARQGSKGDAPSPTTSVHGAVSGGQPRGPGPQPGGERRSAAPPPACALPPRVLQMMGLALWYCLSTTENTRLAAGGRSHGTSGLETPANRAAAGAGAGTDVNQALIGGSSTPSGLRGDRSGRSGSASVAGDRPGSLGRSGSGSVDPLAAQDWLENRMSSATSTAIAPTVPISDEQLAERLLRLAVDAVVHLQGPHKRRVPSSLPPSPATRAQSAGSGSYGSGVAIASVANGGTARPPDGDATDNDDVAVELQTMALWTLAAVLVRFTDSLLNATVFLPLLFPQVDVRGSAGAAVRHPLLQPLLYGDPLNTSLRCGAAAALTALLQKLRPTLQYAEEPQQGRQAAFLSLAAQCGTILSSLHESLCWGLSQSQQQPSQGAVTGTTASATSLATVTPLLNAYAAVVIVTPYHRCPRSRAAVLQTLQLPVMRFFLSHDDVAAFVPATALVAHILRNDTMRFAVTQSPATAESQARAQDLSEAGRIPVAGGDGAAAAVSFLPALLSHADTRAEVWHCMVPLSRLYPRLVQTEFEALMAASVRLVSTLTAWEAAEAAPTASGFATVDGEGDIASDTQRSSAPSASVTPSRSAPSGAGGRGGSDAEGTSLQPPVYREEASARSDTGAALPLPQRSRVPTASLDAFEECLRTWLHYMGYVWKAFDDNASDPAQRPERQMGRATLAHKQRIHHELLRPAMRLRRCGAEVRTMALRCIAQIGNEYISILADRSLCQELVAYVQSSAADAQPRVRGEALTTLGVWLWQYTSMDDFACTAIDSAVHSLRTDPHPVVRTKASFALSNVTGRLPEGSCGVVRDSPDYISTLCGTAMHAAVIDTEKGVQGHGIRMMNHLLQVLSFEELISEVEEFEEGVAEGFLRVLLECLRANMRGGHNTPQEGNNRAGGGAGSLRYTVPREAKHRWNAACALGMGLAREEVFEAEPRYAVEAVDALCTAVVHDHIFKVRTQAAGALGRIPSRCLSGAYTATDVTPTVVGSLCKALETATSTENFRQYKEQGSLHDALRSALAVMITSATPSNELEKVFTSHMKLLQKEGLL